MAWLTITWDNDQLLLLTSRKHGKNATFDRAIAVSLRANVDPATMLSESSIYISTVTPASIAKEIESDAPKGITSPGNAVASPLLHPLLQNRLKAVILREKLLHSDTVVVLGRGGTEVRTMSFPPVPPEEIPDMVRFQASREFSGYEPNAPVDYLLLDDESGESKEPKRRILASTIRTSLLNDIELLCEEAGLNLRRVVLRPCELTALWKEQPNYEPQKTYLLAELDYREASLTIIHRGKPIFMRSPKLTNAPFALAKQDKSEAVVPSYGISSQQELSSQLLAEIKRTLVAAQSETQSSANVAVDEVILSGDAPHHKDLAKHLGESLRIPVRTFNPWEFVNREGELKKMIPPASERFAALIGAADLAALNRPSAIDYYNPKRKPEPVGKQFRTVMIAATVILILIASIAYGYLRKSRFEREWETEIARKESLEKQAAIAELKRKQYDRLYEWDMQKVNWLDEVAWFSRTVPDARDVVFLNLSCRTIRSTASDPVRGNISVSGLARNANVIPPMEEKLREGETHQVQSGKKSGDTTRPAYAFKFDYNVIVLGKKDEIPE